MNEKTLEQTAAEWLFEKLWETPKDKFNWYLIFGQAKQMEKEQIIDAYDAGLFDGSMDDVNDKIYKQYYNQTFKSE
jgi:hypothetical protein